MATRPADIEREIEQRAGVSAAIEEQDGNLIVTGIVSTDGERQAALDIVNALAPEKNVVDNLEVADVMPERIEDMSFSEAAAGDFPVAAPATEDDESLEAGDFTDQEILGNPFGASGPGYTAADEEISEGDESWVPPTDPVRDREGEFIGGFQMTSMDSTRVARSASDGMPGDEAIADALRRELREDAATADLEIDVTVERGVVHLRGSVQSLDDAENAEEVAFRLEGVVDVYDHLEIRDLG